MAVGELITLGVGTPSSIRGLLTFGLSIGEAEEALIVGYVTGTVAVKAIGGAAEWLDPVGGSVLALSKPGGSVEELD